MNLAELNVALSDKVIELNDDRRELLEQLKTAEKALLLMFAKDTEQKFKDAIKDLVIPETRAVIAKIEAKQ